jgi:branched-chain amino acid transport system permease protein
MKRPHFTRTIMWWLIFVGVMCILPLFVPANYIRIAVAANYLAIFAMSWDILSGYTGYVSFGHPFIIGIASYATAIMVARLGYPLYVSGPIAVAVGVGAGMLFFLPGLRLRGNYFCLITLALMMVIHGLVIAIRPDITGGTRGIPGLPLVATGATDNWYVSIALMLGMGFMLWYIAKSDLGRIFNAIRMDEDILATAGLNSFKYKLLAFTISAFVASVGAVFYTHYLGSVSPRSVFAVPFLINIIVAALIGGQNTILGSIMGAYFITFLLEYLRPFAIFAGPQRLLLYSAIALGIYMYNTRGFYGIAQDIANFIRRKRKKSEQYGQVIGST